MLRFLKGNLLDAPAEALVNTVNTVGVMDKGIALMFKEAFPEKFLAYAAAVKQDEVHVGQMFVTERSVLDGPKWLVNFPTKQHWHRRAPSPASAHPCRPAITTNPCRCKSTIPDNLSSGS